MSEFKYIKVILPFNVKTSKGDYRPVYEYVENRYANKDYRISFCGNFIYAKLLEEK